MKISIVTPSYNQGDFLEGTLRSVLEASRSDLEYIVVDGGSKDNSVEIIRLHESQINWWVSEPDAGQYDAVSKGFSHSTGEIMGWLNSDDLYFPWTLSIVSEIFESFPEVEWLSSLFPAILDAKGRVVRCMERAGYSRAAFRQGENLRGAGAPKHIDWIQQEGTFWRRRLWERAGGLDPKYRLAGDFDLWARFFKHADLYGIVTPLAGFRLHGNQRSVTQRDQYLQEARESLSSNGGRLAAPLQRSLRGWIAASCPRFLRPAAARAGWLHRAKVIRRRRDMDGWKITDVYH